MFIVKVNYFIMKLSIMYSFFFNFQSMVSSDSYKHFSKVVLSLKSLIYVVYKDYFMIPFC